MGCCYGIALDGEPDETLSSYVSRRLGADAVAGATIDTEQVTLRVIGAPDGRVELIGLCVHPPF